MTVSNGDKLTMNLRPTLSLRHSQKAKEEVKIEIEAPSEEAILDSETEEIEVETEDFDEPETDEEELTEEEVSEPDVAPSSDVDPSSKVEKEASVKEVAAPTRSNASRLKPAITANKLATLLPQPSADGKIPRITRDILVQSFKQLLEDTEMFTSVTLTESRAFLEQIEEWFQSITAAGSVNAFGFYFGHYRKPACFREPGSIINFISAHEEIKAIKKINQVRKVCQMLPNGTFIAGDPGKDSEGKTCVVPNKADIAAIYPLYVKHLEKCAENLPKEKEKAKRREEKILKRASKVI